MLMVFLYLYFFLQEYRFGGVEGHWGLFDKKCVFHSDLEVDFVLLICMTSSYNLKNITLPNCLAS